MSLISRILSSFSKDKNKYEIAAFCQNCGARPRVKIDKGITVMEGVSTGVACPNCGCQTLFADKATTLQMRNKQLAETKQAEKMQSEVPSMSLEEKELYTPQLRRGGERIITKRTIRRMPQKPKTDEEEVEVIREIVDQPTPEPPAKPMKIIKDHYPGEDIDFWGGK